MDFGNERIAQHEDPNMTTFTPFTETRTQVSPLQTENSTSKMVATPSLSAVAEVVVLVVGFHNAGDIRSCLSALSRALPEPSFDVFICENGGRRSYEELCRTLTDIDGPCTPSVDGATSMKLEMSRFTDIRSMNLRTRSSHVWIGCATDNLGYAGGINAWLEQLLHVSGWKGVWILNPDTEPDPSALEALVLHAELAKKGMVGSTILESDKPDCVRFRGGLHWQRFTARGVAIGLGDRLDDAPDVRAIEAAMDGPSGASMYATRSCIEKVGLMDESYFLFFEDLDWGVRAKKLGLGYASGSVVAHKRGTTTGSARERAAIPRLSVYLQHRNGIRFVRTHFSWSLPARILVSCLYATRFLLGGAPSNCIAALEGVIAGLRGEVGRPNWHKESPYA